MFCFDHDLDAKMEPKLEALIRAHLADAGEADAPAGAGKPQTHGQPHAHEAESADRHSYAWGRGDSPVKPAAGTSEGSYEPTEPTADQLRPLSARDTTEAAARTDKANAPPARIQSDHVASRAAGDPPGRGSVLTHPAAPAADGPSQSFFDGLQKRDADLPPIPVDAAARWGFVGDFDAEDEDSSSEDDCNAAGGAGRQQRAGQGGGFDWSSWSAAPVRSAQVPAESRGEAGLSHSERLESELRRIHREASTLDIPTISRSNPSASAAALASSADTAQPREPRPQQPSAHAQPIGSGQQRVGADRVGAQQAGPAASQAALLLTVRDGHADFGRADWDNARADTSKADAVFGDVSPAAREHRHHSHHHPHPSPASSKPQLWAPTPSPPPAPDATVSVSDVRLDSLVAEHFAALDPFARDPLSSGGSPPSGPHDRGSRRSSVETFDDEDWGDAGELLPL